MWCDQYTKTHTNKNIKQLWLYKLTCIQSVMLCDESVIVAFHLFTSHDVFTDNLLTIVLIKLYEKVFKTM